MALRRKALPVDLRARESAAVAARLLELPEFATAHVVSAFAAMHSELDPSAVVDVAIERGISVVYPRVSDTRPRLRFHRVVGRGDLRRGAFGILEPGADAPEVAAVDIDLMLMPGLAFDDRGRRLGYGGGYYDEVGALLRAAGRGFLVGVAFTCQLVERCPAGPGDVGVDCVVSAARLIRHATVGQAPG